MITRRKFVTALCTATIGFAAAGQSALARNGNNGNGNGGGNGNRGGNGNGGGNGSGGGRGGGSGNSRSNNSSTGLSGKSTTVQDSGSALRVRHTDGISEEVRNGRYIMKDSRGRTIVNRRATSADEKRLQALVD
ncbi:hypothetical protein [Sinorhizobium psoraleae]|uniref:hypothetical protein n=1 Tax=Sinorhizobium psoraleae TaxID=520838 RepID=UPI001569E1E1|nr:hypothetical protein [Sinorhizobium psoraleae]